MPRWTACVLAIVGSLAVMPAVADEGKDESGKGRERGKPAHREGKDGDKRDHHGGRGHDFKQHGHTRIPDGHLPPPGECRLWYPDRPAGQQPPPFKCSSAAPAGAWVLRRPVAAPEQVEAVVYDQRRPGVVIDIGIFDARTGSFLRVQGAPR